MFRQKKKSNFQRVSCELDEARQAYQNEKEQRKIILKK